MRFLRFCKILSIFIRYRLDRLIPKDKLPIWARVLMIPLSIFPLPRATLAVSLRLGFEALGPVFIKFGQVLSTRRDLFTDEISDELQKLQDQVPPFDSQLARTLIEQSLGQSIDMLFDEFEDTPLASASVAQIHTARLKSGEAIVIKIIRPGIENVIQQDLRLLHLLARILLMLWKDAARLHPDQIVSDYERTILDELNLELEAANTSQLRKNWHTADKDRSGKLYVPRVYFDYSRNNVMVMERIYGLSSADIKTMRAKKVNMKKLAHLGVEIFFTQVFTDNFFHADMHPGNVFIDISNPEEPNYIALDSAIIGSLSEDDKTYLAKNLLAFFHQDYYEVARLHVESGWVPEGTDIREFESVIRSVCEPIFQKPIKDISFGRVLMSLFQTARRFDMEVQPQLILLQKTLLNVEGMGRQIYPDLDLWQTAAPYMEKWMKQRMGFSSLFKRISDNAPMWLDHLPDMPQLVYEALTELKTLGQHNRQQTLLLKKLNTELSIQRRQNNSWRIGGLAMLVALLTSFGIYWMFLKP